MGPPAFENSAGAGIAQGVAILGGVQPFPETLRARLEAHGDGLRVLVVRLGAMGDILRTLPPVRLIRFALPDARLYWLCSDRWLDLLRDHPDLDGVVPFPQRRFSLRGLRRFGVRLRETGADLVLDFHGNLRSGLLGAWSGAPVRLGYDGHQQKEGNRWFTTHRVPSGPRRVSRMERNLDLVRALGLPDAPLPDAGLRFPGEAHARADEIVASTVAGAAGFAVIAPGTSRAQAYKKPPPALLAAAAGALATAGIRSLVVWGPGEEADAQAVVAASSGTAVAAPPTRIPELGALLARARLFVGGDTGPMHLACAVGCPVAALYGPTDPEVNAPWGVRCATLYPPERLYTGIKRKDREGAGFDGLTAERVAEGIEDLLRVAATR